MKRQIYLLIITLILLSKSPSVYSVADTTPTPAPSKNVVPTDSDDLEKIQRIKDLVASKVAELNLVEKRGIIGTVREVSNNRVIVTDIKNNSRQIDVDELTDFGDLGTGGISDLEVGTAYSFVGLYNKDTQNLLARSISSISNVPVRFEGALVEINDEDFQLTVVNEKGEEKLVDIQNSTKTSLATQDGELTRSGFSKLEVNQRIFAIGFWDKKNSSLLVASRVIHFETIPPSKEMQSHINLSPTQVEKAE